MTMDQRDFVQRCVLAAVSAGAVSPGEIISWSIEVFDRIDAALEKENIDSVYQAGIDRGKKIAREERETGQRKKKAAREEG